MTTNGWAVAELSIKDSIASLEDLKKLSATQAVGSCDWFRSVEVFINQGNVLCDAIQRIYAECVTANNQWSHQWSQDKQVAEENLKTQLELLEVFVSMQVGLEKMGEMSKNFEEKCRMHFSLLSVGHGPSAGEKKKMDETTTTPLKELLIRTMKLEFSFKKDFVFHDPL